MQQDRFESLWNKWREHHRAIFNGSRQPAFWKDGIVDENAFQGSKKKILFVLKEVNDDKNDSLDLRDFLSDGPHYQLWHTIARLAAGILKDFPDYEEIDSLEEMKQALLKIAAINLKKVPGGASADYSAINAFAFRDRELLIEQIKMIAPDIIVACGVFEQLIWLLELPVNPNAPADAPVLDEKREIRVIPFRHPGRVNNKTAYESLRETCQKPTQNG